MEEMLVKYENELYIKWLYLEICAYYICSSGECKLFQKQGGSNACLWEGLASICVMIPFVSL